MNPVRNEPDKMPHHQKTGKGIPPGWRSPDELPEPPVSRWHRIVSSLRVALGLRPLPPPVTAPVGAVGVVVEREAEPPLEPRDWLRVGQYVLLAFAFVAVIVGAVALYGRASRPTLQQLMQAQSILREAAQRLTEGDLAAAEALHGQLAARSASGCMLSFFEGAMEATYQRVGRPMPEGRPAADSPVEKLAREAGRLEAAGDHAGAERKVAEAVARAPEDLSLRLIHAGLLRALGNYPATLAEAEEIERRTGPSAAVHGLKAQAYLGMKQYAQAQEEFGRALVYEPSSTTLRLGLVDVLTRTRQLNWAAAEALQVLRYDEANPDAYLALGLISEIGNDLAGAERSYRQALRIHPNHVKALNNLAFLLADRLGRAEEALPLAQKAASLAPRSPAIQDTLGWVYHRLGREQEARAAIARARQLDPTYADAEQHWRDLNAPSAAEGEK